MADKLYPPIIEGTIPSFYGSILSVPFQMNRAVGFNQFKKMVLIIKSVNTNTVIASNLISKETNEEYKNVQVASFDILDIIPLVNTRKEEIKEELKKIEEELKTSGLTNERQEELNAQKIKLEEEKNKLRLSIGSFYKVQIAYANQSTDDKGNLEYDKDGKPIYNIGYYSTVGVIKYTSKPTISVNGISEGKDQTYRGIYTNEDITERIYSYRFKVFDEFDGTVFADSGELLYDHSNDIKTETEQYVLYTVNKEFQSNRDYKIQYFVTTVNKLELSSAQVNIVQTKPLRPSERIQFETIINREKGCVSFKLKAEGRNYLGTFSIVRSDEHSDFSVWQQIYLFRLNNIVPDNEILFNDYTVEQGVRYKYALQQVNLTGDVESERFYASEEIKPQFDDMFLFDGERQLKIKFDPKVSSFKKNILETKIETIGNKFPYFLRNGMVEYKEFPIAGLIASEIDDENTFIKLINEETPRRGKNNTPTKEIFENNNLYSDFKIKKERDFKLEVLDWLTDGKPKLFRSPTEGNYIVRLMNVSLTPNETLGRALHSFTSTAYEIAESDYAIFKEYGFVKIPTVDTEVYLWKTFEINEEITTLSELMTKKELNICSIRLDDMIEGDKIILKKKELTQFGTIAGTTETEINIGLTGGYSANCYDEPIQDISWELIKAPSSQLLRPRLLTISYLGIAKKTNTDFDNITAVTAETRAGQFTGSPIVQKVNSENEDPQLIGNSYYDFEEHYIENFNKNNKEQIELADFYTLRFTLRPIINLQKTKNGNEVQYLELNSNTKFNPIDILTLYRVREENKEEKYYTSNGKDLIEIGNCSDFENVNFTKIDFTFFDQLEKYSVNIADTRQYQLQHPENLISFKIGLGIIAETLMQINIINYKEE